LNIQQFATAIDCEGYIGINKMRSSKTSSKPQYSVRISFGMIHPAIPNALRDKFGSTVWLDKSGSHKIRPMYRWCVVGNTKTEAILRNLIPYLIVKKEQALNALAMIEYINSFPKVRKGIRGWTKNTDLAVLESFFQKGKDLNQRTPAETERENPVMGCDSPTLCESIGEQPDAVAPPV
jgi:hypothetical protein